jgi:hypothetical protein
MVPGSWHKNKTPHLSKSLLSKAEQQILEGFGNNKKLSQMSQTVNLPQLPLLIKRLYFQY